MRNSVRTPVQSSGRLRVQTAACAWLALALASVASAQTPQPVLQRGYDPGLSGANLKETILNVSNVTDSTFGMLFTVPVDDAIFAQPLYVPNVAITNQGTHNVVYVATMSDTLYAIDAETGNELWSLNLASLVDATPIPIANWDFGGNKNIVGNLGILSTPAIDTSTNLLYAISGTLENDTLVYRLWAINIADGTRPAGLSDGVVITGSSGGATFNTRYVTQRVSLAISGSNIVFGFGAMEDESADHVVGWMMGYDKSTLQPTGAFVPVPTSQQGGGVWQSGRPAAIDSAGHAYVFSGNSYPTPGSSHNGGYNGKTDFSESVLKLAPAAGMGLVDWFTPHEWAKLDDNDLDLSSAGPLLIPGTTLLAGGGKEGIFYVLHTGALGHLTADDAGAVQEIAFPDSFRGGQVYWNRSAANGGSLIFNWSLSDSLKSFAFNGSQFSGPASQSAAPFNDQNWPGGILALSAWGQQHGTGIVWANVVTSGDAKNNPPAPGALYAFDAENLETPLWKSTDNESRDGLGNFGKFVPPLVANGRVYMATWSNQLAVYGLLSSYTVTPNTLNFGSQPLNTASKQQLLTVTNTGTVPLIIKSTVISSTGPDPFSRTSACLQKQAVPVNGTCKIGVVFEPTSSGSFQAQLSITTGTDAATQTINLSGTGG
jgi:hypothetical protein